MFSIGDCIKVKTRTLNDVFGEVIYRVEAINLVCPECKGNDAIRFLMLGGSGPSARAGYPVVDCPERMKADIAKGNIQFLTPAEAEAAVNRYANKGSAKPGQGIEME